MFALLYHLYLKNKARRLEEKIEKMKQAEWFWTRTPDEHHIERGLAHLEAKLADTRKKLDRPGQKFIASCL